jgi:hypothetical protein
MGLSQQSLEDLLSFYEARIECLERELQQARNKSGYKYVTESTSITFNKSKK